jgi:hypothetical protein
MKIVTRAGFVRVTQLDGDYILYHATLPPIDAAT